MVRSIFDTNGIPYSYLDLPNMSAEMQDSFQSLKKPGSQANKSFSG